MQRLIKLTEDHYVVVDDSPICVNDYYVESADIAQCLTNAESERLSKTNYVKKITHSTEPLGFLTEKGISTANLKPDWINVKKLSLIEIENTVFEYNYGKILDVKLNNELESGNIRPNETIPYAIGLEDGFKLSQKTVRDELFTVADMKKAFQAGSAYSIGSHKDLKQTHPGEHEFILSMLPKRGWDIEINEEGKITLI